MSPQAAGTHGDPSLLKSVHRKAREEIERNLLPGETIQVVVLGPSNQTIIGTDRRAFVYKKGFMAGASFGSEVTTWAYKNLVGVQIHTGMMSGAVILQGPGQQGTKTSYWKQGDSDPYKAPNAIPIVRPFDDAKSGVARLRHLIEDAHNSVSPARDPRPAPMTSDSTASIMVSVADELRKLADLRDAGLLSEDEFAAQRRRLLG